MLTKVFGPRWKVTGHLRQQHDEGLRGLYSLNVMWAKHIAHIGKKRHPYKILVGNPRERDHFQNLGVEGTVKGEVFFSLSTP